MKVDMFMPEARNCSTVGLAIKYHIHVYLCDPLPQYGGIVRLFKKKKKSPENRKKMQDQLAILTKCCFQMCLALFSV